MWYQDYKKTSYKINTASDQSIGLVACWLFKSIGTNYYDMVSSAPLRQMIPTGNPSPFYDPLYQVSPRFGSGVYQARNLFLIPPSSQYMSDGTTGETGEYRGSFAIFARFYYHPSYYNATGVLAGFSSGRNDLAHGLYLTEDSVIRFTVDNQLTYASGTIDLPEGWVDAWGIYDSGANPNTKVIIQGVEGNSVYSNATIIQPNPASPNLERSFVVAGDKGSGNTYRHAFSEVRIYNYAPPLGLAQKVYEPKDLNKLFNFEEDKLFNSVAETGVPMYIAAATKDSGGLPLFMKTIESGSRSLTFYTAGPIQVTGGMNLYMKVSPGSNKGTTLMGHGSNLSYPGSYESAINGYGYKFNGTAYLKSSGLVDSLLLDTDKTIAGWIKIGDIGRNDGTQNGNQVILSDSSGTLSINYNKFYTASNIGYSVVGVVGGGGYSHPIMHQDLWTFFCYRYEISTNTHDFYAYNASGSVTSTPQILLPATIGSGFNVGASSSGTNRIKNNGMIDQLHIWNRRLSDVEVASVKNTNF
jgi:hypothetical protein